MMNNKKSPQTGTYRLTQFAMWAWSKFHTRLWRALFLSFPGPGIIAGPAPPLYYIFTEVVTIVTHVYRGRYHSYMFRGIGTSKHITERGLY